jgi:molybdopterin/thiamine biosynthesis adenylyltransferase
MLYSDDLTLFEGITRPEVSEAIQAIKKYFNHNDLKVYLLDDFNIGVAAQFKVSLPSRGSVNNLIIETEPILINLSLTKYPERAPAIMSDRKNFPKNRLPHLYYSPENKPATLCLVRDSLNQWFSTVTIKDFLLVGSLWYYKAATGTLLQDNNEFDPVRLKNTFAKHVFKYETFRDILEEDRRLINSFPMALILSSLDQSDFSNDKAFKSIKDIPFIYLKDLKSIISTVYKNLPKNEKFAPLYSILVWDSEQNIEGNYFTNFPTNYKSLTEFLKLRGIDIEAILVALKIAKVPIRTLLPIIHAIKRPCKVIGYDGNYEFITYTVLITDDYNGVLENETKVYISSHSEPFSSELAYLLSNEKRETGTLFIGAGSLGSKILMHDARIGKNKIGVADDDVFEQHNIGRHALFANKIGKNKAEAVIEEVKAFYDLDPTNELMSFNKLISDIDNEVIEKYNLLVDSTASQQVLQHLTLRKLNQNAVYAKCELVDDGEIGLLYVEGSERNPRMDDLVNYACYLATENSELENWRRNDAKREPDTLNIGLGCNSVTTVMPDDIISFHASTFSQILASKQTAKSDRKGLLYMNISRMDDGIPKISNETFMVYPFEIYECGNNSGWTLRMFSGLSDRLLKLCSQYGNTETGGVLVGVANYKTKIIHVFDVIIEPIDSSGSPVAFTRGINGLPKQIDDIKLKTGEVIGYIGEWHTHPMNLETLSGTDLNTIEILKNINLKTPIPTCAVIVTQTKILPFVYD